MQKPVKLTVINNHNDLLITKATLLRNMKVINEGKRFNHFEEGHDQYVRKVTESLRLVEDRLEKLKK
ncbi:hypothetical protein QPK13_23225 [Photorhabdus tasmaniensis]